jgi:DNA-binding MarR family transcriptional regulator
MPARSRSETPAPLARSLTYRLHLLHKITDQVSQQRYEQELGMSLSDGRCLATIGSFGPLSVNELAEHSNLNKSQASRGAQALVDQGFVIKVDHPEDGRGVLLELTPGGRRLWARSMALIDERNADIFGCLSAREQQALSEMFDRLIDHNRRS